MSQDELSNYLNVVFKKILEGNPSLKADPYKLLLLRTAEPNASNFGDGLILFNLGLLAFIDFESELAFILAHEIAHNELDHINKGLLLINAL